MEKKKVQTELLRLLCIYLVIFNHTRNHGFSLYVSAENQFTCIGSLTFAIFCKIAVPVFFMISGSLLLGKEETINSFFKKRVLRIIIVILLFTLFQYIRICRAQGLHFELKSWLLYSYCGNIIEPYWFLKAYLGYLLAVPFLRKIVKDMDKILIKYLFILVILKIIVSFIKIYSGYLLNVTLELTTDILLYPLLGYYLEHSDITKYTVKAKNKFILLSFMGIMIIVNVLLAKINYSMTMQWSDDFLTIFTAPYAIVIFMLFKGINITNDKISKLIVILGGNVFGVYLIEDVVRNIVEFRLGWNYAIPSPFISSLLFTLVCEVIGLFIIYVVRKIPLVSRLI